jgi:hypothetical protein
MLPESGRLVEPRREDAVEDDSFEVDLLDPDRLEVGLVVEPAGRVVVAATVAGRDVERHVQAAGDLVEDLLLELGVGRRGLLRLQLRHLPTAGHGDERPLLQLNRLERFGGVGLAAGRRVGVEDAGEVGGRLGGGDHSEGEPPQLGEQRQRRQDVRDAPR